MKILDLIKKKIKKKVKGVLLVQFIVILFLFNGVMTSFLIVTSILYRKIDYIYKREAASRLKRDIIKLLKRNAKENRNKQNDDSEDEEANANEERKVRRNLIAKKYDNEFQKYGLIYEVKLSNSLQKGNNSIVVIKLKVPMKNFKEIKEIIDEEDIERNN